MLTDDEIRQDLTMIKNLGCNYCRLVHYPHRKKTLEIADEIGLFVSEEPGLWWSNMKDQTIVDSSLEVLRRTVTRDRNHVSVAFWLSFNECIFTPEFIKESGRVCREYDPYRMVSGANCMSIERTKQFFKECGFDFYTMHPYDSTPKRMIKSIEELTLQDLKQFSPAFEEDIYEAVSLKTCVEKRLTLGAPGSEMMKKVIGQEKEWLGAWREKIEEA